MGVVLVLVLVGVVVLLIVNRSRVANVKSMTTVDEDRGGEVTLDIEMYTDVYDGDDMLVVRFDGTFQSLEGFFMLYRMTAWALFPDVDNPGMVQGISCAAPWESHGFKGHNIDVYNAYGEGTDYSDLNFSNEGDEIWEKTDVF